MAAAAVAAGVLLVLLVLGDAFETVILPRGLTRAVRFARWFFRAAWAVWSAVALRMRTSRRREGVLSYFGPLSLILLVAVWGAALVCGFGLIQWGLAGGRTGFFTSLYFSGTTFFTLGLGDIAPKTAPERLGAVVEAGVGFGFLAIVIGYLPVLYQAFSRREIAISLLDARGGSPPTAAELLRRHGVADGGAALNQLLRDWEQWSAELLESHLSYPVLCYYRSQHDRQSWVSAMAAVLDASALVMLGVDGVPTWQARLTFAMARHAVVDLAAIFDQDAADTACPDRLPDGEMARLRDTLSSAGIRLPEGAEADARLHELRCLYEPYIQSLADRLAFAMPPFVPADAVHDAWETTALHAEEAA